MEIHKIARGGGNVKNGSQTIFFISHYDKPHNRKSIYLRIVAEDKPHKKEKKRIVFTISGDHIEYKGKLDTPNYHLTTIRLHLNTVVSTPGDKYGTADIANFDLETQLDIYEYTRINISDITDEI